MTQSVLHLVHSLKPLLMFLVLRHKYVLRLKVVPPSKCIMAYNIIIIKLTLPYMLWQYVFAIFRGGCH